MPETTPADCNKMAADNGLRAVLAAVLRPLPSEMTCHRRPATNVLASHPDEGQRSGPTDGQTSRIPPQTRP